MTRPVALLFLAAFGLAATSTAFGQVSDSTVYGPGSLHKSTPSPSPGSSAGSVASGKPLEANLSRAKDGTVAVTTFTKSDKAIYLAWRDGLSTKGEVLRAVWNTEKNGVAKKQFESTETAGGPGAYGSFSLFAPATGFPAGKYRVDLYDGPKKAKSLEFTVK